jgi:hypothetical protein
MWLTHIDLTIWGMLGLGKQVSEITSGPGGLASIDQLANTNIYGFFPFTLNHRGNLYLGIMMLKQNARRKVLLSTAKKSNQDLFL